MPRREGWGMNAKRIYRLYIEDGLAVRTKLRKKIARPSCHRPIALSQGLYRRTGTSRLTSITACAIPPTTTAFPANGITCRLIDE
jgi:hypothetical protein